MLKANNFTPFIGVIEGLDDPEELGRVQVRAYGYHTKNKEFIPTEFLHWFTPIVCNSAGVSGIGYSPTGLRKGSTVFGYFLDIDLQEGIVIGSMAGKPSHFAFTNLGFNDPDGTYPIYTNESDVNRLARGEESHWLFNTRANARVTGVQGPLDSGSWDEPAYGNQSKYPDNHVFETPKGHIKEFDDTEGNERIHEYHRSGTYYEVLANGDRVVKVIGDGYEITAGSKNVLIAGDVNLTIQGNCNQYIMGDWNIQVDGDKKEVVLGTISEYYEDQKTQVTGTKTTNADQVEENSNSHDVKSGKITHNEG